MNAPAFKLYLHGPFNFSCGEKVLLQFRGDKARALLAYLVLQRGQPVPRQQLTTLLWDGYPPASAKASLRVTLSNLRQLLAPWELLKSNHRTVQLDLDAAQFWCDALALEQVLAPDKTEPVAARWTEVQRLHQGEFLAGFESIDSQAFRTWVYARRIALQQQIAQIRSQVVIPTSIPTNLTRSLTPLFGRQIELRALQQRITNPSYPLVTVVGQGGVGKTRLVLAVAQSIVDRLTAGSNVEPEVAANTGELGSYNDLMCQFNDGIWFVALADLAPAANVAEQLAVAIGTALHIPFVRTGALTDQLRDYLREKALLLILDNFEQLQAGVSYLLTLLQEAQHLTLLITSRQPLNLQAEFVFTLRGLPVPDESTEEPSMTSGHIARRVQMSPSLQLFYERVRRTVTNFRPNQHTYADMAAICRLVNGLPLAIELAASQVRYRPCHEIRQTLAANYATLTTDLGDVPARHRSLRVVLDDSWCLLSTEEAEALECCTLFQGGFTSEAAVVTTAASPLILHWLEQKSFLLLEQSNRYTIHTMVRQYAEEMFQAAGADLMTAAQQRHSHYYLKLVSTQEVRLQGAESQSAAALIRQELLNIQSAWRWAVAHGRLHDLAQASTGLANFYQMAGLVLDCSTDFALAAEVAQTALAQPALTNEPDLVGACAKLLCACAQLLLALGENQAVMLATQQVINLTSSGRFPEFTAIAFCYQGKVLVCQGKPVAAREQFEAALALATKVTPLTQIELQLELGNLALSTTRYDEAQFLYEMALALSRVHQFVMMEVRLLQKLAALYHALADYEQVNRYGEAALHLAQQIGARHIADHLLGNLGIVWAVRGDYAMAQQYFTRALTAHRQSGDQIQQAHTLSNLGTVMSRIGDYAAALAYAQKSQQMMQQLGAVEEQPSTLTNLSYFAGCLGDYPVALKYARQGLLHSQQTQKRSKEAYAWTVVGDALAGLAQWTEAASAYTQGVAVAHALTLPHEAIYALAGLVRVTLAQGGSHMEVMDYLEKILAFHARTSLMTLEEPFAVYLTCYQALAAYADPRADALLREAHQQLQSRAAFISDDTMRQAFLTRVVAHQTLLTLVQALVPDHSHTPSHLPNLSGASLGRATVTQK